MKTETRRPVARGLKRASAVIRAWDGPNSRVALELDLDQMPWSPFEALGKEMTLLIPTEVGPIDPPGEREVERALRHVEHAADRCAEFSRLGNGSEQLWRHSLETWQWLRSYLTHLWISGEPEGEIPLARPGLGSETPVSLPHMPGAAATVDAAAKALRSMPLVAWNAAMGDRDPDAPTREEAIQTLLGLVRLLNSQPPTSEAPSPPEAPADDPAPSASEELDEDELSFDYASGYDEGYQMGRRVGKALATREFRERHSSYR